MYSSTLAQRPPSPHSLLPQRKFKDYGTLRCYHFPPPLPPATTHTLSLILNSGVIACLRANTAELAFEAASAAIRGGISVLEIVASTPGVFQVIQRLVEDYPTAAFGVGTVLNAEDAFLAKSAGAKFIMSPATVADIMDCFKDDEVLYMPGAMTPTEILSAFDASAKIVKVYPVSALGGSQYISTLKKPFPHIPMVASQGIKIDSIDSYISCGASSVVLSDAIFDKELMAQRNFDAICQLACLASSQGSKSIQRHTKFVLGCLMTVGEAMTQLTTLTEKGMSEQYGEIISKLNASFA